MTNQGNSKKLSVRSVHRILEGKKRKTAGIQQGSVLGSPLCNIFFNYVLELEYEIGVELTAYTNDIGRELPQTSGRNT